MRVRSKRGTAVLAVVTGSILITTACGGDTSSDDGPVELRMVTWTSSEAHLGLLNSIADAYLETTDAVSEITFDSVTVDTIGTVLTTQLASDEPPDLSWLPIESSREYIDAGALVDVEETLSAIDGYGFDDLIPELQERWRTSDGQYGIPFSTGPFIMYYNADVYRAAGVSNPQEMIEAGTWDWAHFRQASRTIAESQGIPGYTINDFEYQNWTRLIPLMYAYGASPWDDAATSCTMNTPEMAAAMDLLHGMIYEDGSVPLPGQQSNFWGGQAASTSAFLSSTSLLQDATFQWGIAPMPEGPGGAVQAVGQAAIVAFAAGHHTEAAVDFLAFLTNPENSAALATYFPPARASLRTAEVMAESAPLVTADQLAPILEQEYGLFPVAAKAGAVADVMNKALQESLFSADADISAALGQVCTGIEPLLSQE